MAFLEVKQISFEYDNQKILDDISFKMEKSQIFCLIGPNGSGKTTMLDCIMGLLSLKSGKIFLQGQDISQLNPKQIAQNIAYVPQNHKKTFPYTVKEIVLMGRAAHNGLFNSPNQHDHLIAHNAIETAGIEHLKERPYTELSGGEGQLVMIARALAQEPTLLIMDEPTTHLDFQNSLVVLESIKYLVRKKQISVLLATHHLNHAFYFENNGLDTIAAMLNQKNFAVIGRPNKILSKDNIEKVFNINCQIIDYHSGRFQNQKYIIPLETIN